MANPQVTLMVVPRERFSLTERTLENIYENTTYPFRLVYVSAGSPGWVRRYLEKESGQKGFQLVHTDHFLSPNQARNLGLGQVKTRYVVFLDNDALVAPGWLEALVNCAEETGAWIVGSLYLIGELENQTIHMAGGKLHTREEQGQRVLYDEHRLVDKPMSELDSPLQRGLCDFVEYHCMLVRTDLFERLGPLDEQLLSLHEHIDVCLAAQKAGGSVYVEPKAVTTYIPPPPGDLGDLPYFMLRWSDAWNLASMRRFKEKWGMSSLRNFHDPAEGDPEDSLVRWGRAHRRRLTGLGFPPDGMAGRPESPLEEAQLLAALFESVDRDSFDLSLTTGSGDMVERVAALNVQALLGQLPGALQKAEECDLNVSIRPLASGAWNEPALIRLDDLDPDAFARVRSHAFVSLETGPQVYQSWLAVARGPSRSSAALRGLTGTAAVAEGTAPLAGTRNIRPELRRADGSYPRVRLVEAHTGLLNPVGQLKGKELTPYLWAGHLF